MISKHYTIFCDKCTTTEELFSSNVKDCESEAKRSGWVKNKDYGWICADCNDKIKNEKGVV